MSRFAHVLRVGLVAAVAAWGCSEGASAPENDAPTISLTAPTGGAAVAPGGTVDIAWTVVDDGSYTVALTYTANGVTTPQSIATGQTGADYTWTVPAGPLFGIKIQATVTDDAGQTAQDETDAFLAVVNASARGYVTAATCQTCHSTMYTQVFKSGHPYKIQKIVNGQPPAYPTGVPAAPSAPTGFSYSNLTYVIGGYGYKTRFMDQNGYVLTNGTAGTNVQYNIARADLGSGLAGAWGSYETSTTTPKPYTCGTCHTTGWLTTADNGGVNQDGLIGILGTWEEPGIRCEQCHGPGVDHVVSQSADDITVNLESELCGSCHYRDINHRIEASGTSIRHHEQYDEMIAAGHRVLRCSDCHDPHIGVKYGNAAAGGITRSCTSCHTGYTSTPHINISCESCHMGRASRTARSVQTYEHDIRTHIFKVNSAAVDRTTMFYQEDGKTFSYGFVTLDYACYSCHKDASGVGGSASQKTLAELSAKAVQMHP